MRDKKWNKHGYDMTADALCSPMNIDSRGRAASDSGPGGGGGGTRTRGIQRKQGDCTQFIQELLRKYHDGWRPNTRYTRLTNMPEFNIGNFRSNLHFNASFKVFSECYFVFLKSNVTCCIPWYRARVKGPFFIYSNRGRGNTYSSFCREHGQYYVQKTLAKFLQRL